MRHAALLILAACSAGAQTGSWLRLQTSHFELFSRANEEITREIAKCLETAREVMGYLEPGEGNSPIRPRVFIFISQKEFDEYRVTRGSSKAGYYHGSSAGDVIALLYSPANWRRVVLHEYAHLVLHGSGGRLPVWLDEGLAEVYSGIVTRGSVAFWGGPHPIHLRRLATGTLLNAPTFFAIHSDSEQYVHASRAGLFYAQSWALTHMLRFAPRYSGGVSAFRQLLKRGVPEPEAFERAFHKTPAAATSELEAYIRTGAFSERRLSLATHLPLVEPALERLSAHESSFALAGLLLQVGRPERARRLYDRLSASNRSDAAFVKSMGDLALAQGERDEARSYYERALSLDSSDPGLYFEYAMLLRDEGAPVDRVQPLLERAIKLNPNLAGLHQFLGNRALDEGNYTRAIDMLTKAAALEPEQPSLWISLALAHRGAGDRQAAITAAQRARSLARDETEIHMAEATREGLESIKDASHTAPPSKTVVPESWKNPKGDRRLEGELVRVDCEGASAKLHVRSAGATTILAVADPRKVVLRGAPGVAIEFRCGTFEAVEVAVEYIASPPPLSASIAGEVTTIEFR